MKYFIALLVVGCVIGLSESITREEKMEMFEKSVNDCAAKEGSSQQDIDETFAHKAPSTKSGKCLRACLAENIGMMKNNRLDVEGSTAVARVIFDGDEAKMKAASEVGKQCENVTDPDRCEAAFKIFECCHNTSNKLGLNFEEKLQS